MFKSKDPFARNDVGASAEDAADAEQLELSSVGARNVALFLSILDSNDAEKILSLFNDDVARQIAREASRVGRVHPKDVEKVVADFIDSVGRDVLGDELANTLANEARKRGADFDVDVGDENEDVCEENDGDFVISHSLDMDKVRDATKGERLPIRALAASLLTEKDRDSLLKVYSKSERSLITRYLSTLKSRVSADVESARKRMEDVLLERARRDE